jgi:hypothetical protein
MFAMLETLDADLLVLARNGGVINADDADEGGEV